MKREAEVRAFLLEEVCDKCQNGLMNATDVVKQQENGPPLTTHKCSNTECDHTMDLPDRLPRLTFRRLMVQVD